MLINERLFPDYAKFIRTLGCPLCGSELFGNCHPCGSQLYCAEANDEYDCHYKCGWTFDYDEPFYETTKHVFSKHQFTIYNRRLSSKIYDIEIVRYRLSEPNKLQSGKLIFSMKGARLLFFNHRMDENTFLDKLKLYNVFS